MLEEMVLRILPRLPSKSLMRFKCVRKSWYSVINNPMFVESHLSNSMHNKLSTCVLFKRFVQSDANSVEKELGFSFLYLPHDYNDDQHKVNVFVEDIKFPPSTRQFIGLEVIESLSIIGHCNGIVCLSDYSDNIVLCNPAIKELGLVPKSCLAQLFQCGVGFGYDPKSKDYKVQRISCDGEEIYDGQRLVFFPPRVEIYSLSTDSWREIKNNYLETEDTFFWPQDFGMYSKGICFWLGYEQPKEFESYIDRLDDEQKKTVVFFFDMGDEVFHNILLPDSLYEGSTYRYDMRILLWNESISLFGFDSFGTFDDRYGLWVLDDFDGAKGSWTRHLTFEHMAGIQRVLEFWKSDEIHMVTRNGDIVSYNLDTDKLKNLPMNTETPSRVETIVYVNTLVPVMGSNKLASVDK